MLTLELAPGQPGIREDVRALQAGMLAQQSELRAEMRDQQAGLRAELRAGPEELREEIQADRAGGRTELARFRTGLAVVEHRTEALEARPEGSGQPEPQPCERVACPGS